MEGLSHILKTIKLVKKALNPSLSIEGILLTMYDARNNLSRQVSDEIRTHFPRETFTVVIPSNIRLSEAPSHGKPIILYDIAVPGGGQLPGTGEGNHCRGGDSWLKRPALARAWRPSSPWRRRRWEELFCLPYRRDSAEPEPAAENLFQMINSKSWQPRFGKRDHPAPGGAAENRSLRADSRRTTLAGRPEGGTPGSPGGHPGCLR